MTMVENSPQLRFVQIGDLHLTGHGLQNHQDFLRIVEEIDRNCAGLIDFVYLPGDNADDGTPDQFALVREGLSGLRLPWHAIPGDHDFKPRSLQNYYRDLSVRTLPYAQEVNGYVCLFLDVVSQGTGGPDFKLGEHQFDWLRSRLDVARREGKSCVVFMHAYPADLGEEAGELAALLDESSVMLVAMGHTHYNEVSHDGRTIYAATRSTGQIEEGPAGYSFFVADGHAVSWRFKPLGSPWPFVMITSPADRRLAISEDHRGTREVHATSWGEAPVTHADFRIDEGPWLRMSPVADGRFVAPLEVDRRSFRIEVRATDRSGAHGTDLIECASLDGVGRVSSGSDANSIGAWPERHLFGTQLGPNRNGRKW